MMKRYLAVLLLYAAAAATLGFKIKPVGVTVEVT